MNAPAHTPTQRKREDVDYNVETGIVTIFGMKYDIEMFAHMAFSPTNDGKWFRIKDRNDGVVTVEVEHDF